MKDVIFGIIVSTSGTIIGIGILITALLIDTDNFPKPILIFCGSFLTIVSLFGFYVVRLYIKENKQDIDRLGE